MRANPLCALFLVGGCLIGGGCGDPNSSGHGDLFGAIGSVRQAIAGGHTDAEETNVVGVADLVNGGVELCSGSLLAPNVVLTARHCVSDLSGTATGGGVVCGQTTFQRPHPATGFFVTTLAQFTMNTGDYHAVQEVAVLTGNASDVCGNDVAILILANPIADSEATPLVPRVDEPLVDTEFYSAVGYGATSDQDTSTGIRRRRDGLSVGCVADDCGGEVTEWTGDQGVCHGDSGGPALDAKGRVTGVASRGEAGCLSPIYGYPYGWAQFIKQTTARATSAANIATPKWVDGWPTDPAFSAPVGGACAADMSCPSAGTCLNDPDQVPAESYCTRKCNGTTAPCDVGYYCPPTNGLCTKNPPPAAPTPDPSTAGSAQAAGCAVGGHGAEGNPALLLCGLAGVVLGFGRRRRMA